jgi:hypothetical protein
LFAAREDLSGKKSGFMYEAVGIVINLKDTTLRHTFAGFETPHFGLPGRRRETTKLFDKMPELPFRVVGGASRVCRAPEDRPTVCKDNLPHL